MPPEAPPDCPLCPRLVAFREANEAAHPEWFNGAVPSFAPEGGEEFVRLLIIGLAPGLQGANKTGRPFTGDYAGDLLYATLIESGLASGPYERRPDDALTLRGVMVTNAVRCVPPQNKPTAQEANTCRGYLQARMAALPNLRALLCLGKISHDSTLRALGARVASHPFGHEASYDLQGPNGPLTLVSSYHCSRYNTNTGVLTEAMFDSAVRRAKSAAGL
nr:uracil-DNA glycosylase [Parvularcula dongshanensis]